MLTDRLSARLAGWRLRRIDGRRKVSQHAPYPLELYRSIVQQAKKQRLPIGHFSDPAPVESVTRIFLRHDIDYAGCVSGAPAMLDINLSEQVPTAAFLRMDGEAYDPAEARDLVGKYRPLGVEFGLHTSCYAHQDYLSALAHEKALFRDTYGFDAKTFTVHGLGEVHLQRRLEFTAFASVHLPDLGFDYSDCTATLRPYHLVFQDCDTDPVTGQRAIYDTTETLPPLLRRGHNYLILTHPCYWQGS